MKLGLFGAPTDVNGGIYNDDVSIRLDYEDKGKDNLLRIQTCSMPLQKEHQKSKSLILTFRPLKCGWVICAKERTHVSAYLSQEPLESHPVPSMLQKFLTQLFPQLQSGQVIFNDRMFSRRLRSPLAPHGLGKEFLYLLRA